jgi:hypothetical protein
LLLVKELMQLLVKEELNEAKRVREADISDGSRVPRGSSKHVRDLESRIESLVMWRDRCKRGSEQRANYSRLVSRLKAELASAKHVAEKKRS